MCVCVCACGVCHFINQLKIYFKLVKLIKVCGTILVLMIKFLIFALIVKQFLTLKTSGQMVPK